MRTTRLLQLPSRNSISRVLWFGQKEQSVNAQAANDSCDLVSFAFSLHCCLKPVEKEKICLP